MSSSNSLDFNVNGREQIQYKTTTINEDGVTETKVLTIFFDDEMKSKVPTKSMLDESWFLVKDTTMDNEDALSGSGSSYVP